VPLAKVRYQSLFNVAPYLTQSLTTVAIMKVTSPASYSGINFFHYPVKRHNRASSRREFGHAVFDLLQGFLRWLNMGIVIPRFPAFAHPDAESKEIKLIFEGIDDLRLCLVQGKFQPPQYLSQYCHCLAGFVSPAEEDNIVSVPDDAGTQPLL
jgi:hypothetical protein